MTPLAVLIGLPGSGKTTIGRRLGRALNADVVDSDELIAQSQGKPCGDILRELGESRFREIEYETIREALSSFSGVVSLGGGAVTYEPTRRLLRDHFVIFLDVSIDEGYQRTVGDGDRPLLDVDDPQGRYTELYHQRRDFYNEVAKLRIKCDNQMPQKIVTTILNQLETTREHQPAAVVEAAPRIQEDHS